MNWKKQIEGFEGYFGKSIIKDWKPAIELAKKIIIENQDDYEAYIRVIYLLHNIILEEHHEGITHEQIEVMLSTYFNESKIKFSRNPEYLFFIGKILYIAEWYFGINEGSKPTIEYQAFKMQKKASELEPNNILYELAWRFSLGEKIAGYLASQILLYDKEHIEWLKSKGFPGDYILDSLDYSKRDFEGKILH